MSIFPPISLHVPMTLPRLLLVLVASFAASACDSTRPISTGGFDPSTINYDTVTSLNYEQTVRPLLVARNALAPTATTEPGSAADYDYENVMMAGPSGFIVPFDAEGSLLVRFWEDLLPDAEIPFPNLRSMEADEVRLLKRWIEDGARREPAGMPGFGDATDLLMVGVQGENHVAIVDAETHRVIRRVYLDDHGIESTPYGPHHFAFEPDGSAWYTSLVSAGVVVKLKQDLMMDPSDPAYLLGRTPDGAFVTPGMLALDPTSDAIYVGRSTLSDPLASGFGVLDRASMTYDVVATPFNVPHAMTVTPDGRYALTAELTGTQDRSRVAVYDTESGDLTLVDVPVGDASAPREFIHFSILGAHHMGGMDHGGMDHGAMASYPYTATLTSRATDEVLFFSLDEDGTLTLEATAPAGDGPYHAHATHDGADLLIPDQRGDAVSILDAETRAITATVAASAPTGPLSQPHSPAPGFEGRKFFVTNSNLNGAWTPPFAFGGAEARSYGNLAVFDMDGTVLEVIQLGAYPSGVEPVRIAVHDHGAMDHSEGDHSGMDH